MIFFIRFRAPLSGTYTVGGQMFLNNDRNYRYDTVTASIDCQKDLWYSISLTTPLENRWNLTGVWYLPYFRIQPFLD